MLDGLMSRIEGGGFLARDEAAGAFEDMLGGRVPEDRVAGFLSGLARRGESDDELLGMLDVMRKHMIRVDPDTLRHTIDLCGTGGDGMQTFNISTAAAFLAAVAGARVAKHGNRSSSGVSGSADVFEFLGYDLSKPPGDASRILKRHGICFIFAQKHHPAMKAVARARRRIGTRTAFNILGPLCNPAGVRRQLVGVSSGEMLERIPRILHKTGSEAVMAVRSANGMDEFSTGAKNEVCSIRDGAASRYVVNPADLGLRESALADIVVHSREEAMSLFLAVLYGTANRGATDTVILNAAAALAVAGAADGLGDGLDAARDALESGRAEELLKKFVTEEGDVARLEVIPRA